MSCILTFDLPSFAGLKALSKRHTHILYAVNAQMQNQTFSANLKCSLMFLVVKEDHQSLPTKPAVVPPSRRRMYRYAAKAIAMPRNTVTFETTVYRA